MNTKFNDRQKKMLLFFPIFVWISAFGGNALINYAISDPTVENMDAFQMTIPDADAELITSKKEAYDKEFNDSLALYHKDKHTGFGWNMGSEKPVTDENSLENKWSKSPIKDKDQSIVDSILAGNNTKSTIYKSNTQSSYVPPSPTTKIKKNPTPVTTIKVEPLIEEAPLFNQLSSNNKTTDEGTLPIQISAAIFGDQKVKHGTTVSLILKEDILINGKQLKKNSTIYGVAAFNGARLNIIIKNIVIKGSPIAVNYMVFDEYYNQGIIIDEINNNDESINNSGASVVTDVVTGLPGGKYIDDIGGLMKKDKTTVFLIDGLPIYLNLITK